MRSPWAMTGDEGPVSCVPGWRKETGAPTAGRSTRAYAPARTLGWQCRGARRGFASSDGHRFPGNEIFSPVVGNHLPSDRRNAPFGRGFQGFRGWHASWIRGDRDAPGGLPSLSPRHGLSIARRHRGTNRCLTAPVVSSPSTRVPAWPHGTPADKDDAAGRRKRKDEAAGCRTNKDDAAGRRTGKDDAAGSRTGPAETAGPVAGKPMNEAARMAAGKDDAAGSQTRHALMAGRGAGKPIDGAAWIAAGKDDAARSRTRSATTAGPRAGKPIDEAPGNGAKRTRQEAVRSQARWRGSGQGRLAGPAVQTTGPADFLRIVGDAGGPAWMHRGYAKPCRVIGEPGVRWNEGVRVALGGMLR